jgi:hypothetical protein
LPRRDTRRPGIGTAEKEYPSPRSGTAHGAPPSRDERVYLAPSRIQLPLASPAVRPITSPRGRATFPSSLELEARYCPSYGKSTYYSLTSGHRARTARHLLRAVARGATTADQRSGYSTHSTGEHNPFLSLIRHQISRRSLELGSKFRQGCPNCPQPWWPLTRHRGPAPSLLVRAVSNAASDIRQNCVRPSASHAKIVPP